MAIFMLLRSFFLSMRTDSILITFSQSLKKTLKLFASLYTKQPFILSGLYESENKETILISDIILLFLHLALITIGNYFLTIIPLYGFFIILEISFYLSTYLIKIKQFQVNYLTDVNTALISYLLDTVLLLTPKIYDIFQSSQFHPSDQDNSKLPYNQKNEDQEFKAYGNLGRIFSLISLIIHALQLTALILKYKCRLSYEVIIRDADCILMINLKQQEDNNNSLNSSIEVGDEKKQICLISQKNTIKLIKLTYTSNLGDKKKSDLNSNCQKVTNGINNTNLINDKQNMLPITLSELAFSVQNQFPSLKNAPLEEKNQGSQFQRDMTVSKMTDSIIPKLNLEDEPTVRKTKMMYESPSIIPILSNFTPSHQNQKNITNLSAGTNIGSAYIHTLPNSQSCVFIKDNKEKIPSTIEQLKKQNSKSKLSEEICLGAENLQIEVLNTIEVKSQNQEIELIFFHEEFQQVLVRVQGAVLFYSVPDFKKKKSILLDSQSEYIFSHQTATCIQYHYTPESSQFQFTPLNLAKEQITKDDMKYSSITIQNTECNLNGLMLLASFKTFEQNSSSRESDNKDSSAANKNNGKEILFIRDGYNLITIDIDSLQMETYENRFESDDDEDVKVVQFNKRQVITSSPNLFKFAIFDIPTNLCHRIINDLPLGSTVTPILNLQNQIIINTNKLNKNCSIFDLITKQSLKLADCCDVVSAQYSNKYLFIIDHTHTIKLFNLSHTSFNFTPAYDVGISCVSVALS